LLSIRSLCWDNNCHVIFDFSYVRAKNNTIGDILLQAFSSGPVYTIPHPASLVSVPTTIALTESAHRWHRHWLDHCGASVLDTLCERCFLEFKSIFFNICMSCCLAKSHRLPFYSVEHRTNYPLQLIHSDVKSHRFSFIMLNIEQIILCN